MKNSKSIQFILILFSCILGFQSVIAQDKISYEDFSVLNNTSWKGTLTYSDYQSGELVPISATMQVFVSEKGIEQNIQYTYEPNKNVKAVTKIRKNGRYLGKQEVVSKTIGTDGTITIITLAKAKDDNKKATLHFTYIFSSNSYKVTKEVQFDDSTERFFRNSYEYVII